LSTERCFSGTLVPAPELLVCLKVLNLLRRGLGNDSRVQDWNMRNATSLAALLLVIVLVGCGSGDLVPVSGTITLDGKPLANASVTFQPVGLGSKEAGAGSYGKTDANGRYSLRVISTKEQKGAVVGKHRVAVSMGVDNGSDVIPVKEPLPARYNNKTILEFDVPSGGSEKADFSLDSKPDPPPRVDRDS
jgi:hypothetical protein